jgi:polyhydroxybutyrate depolymerase
MRTRLLAVSGILVLVLAACSSGGDDAGSKASSSTAKSASTAAAKSKGCAAAAKITPGEEKVTTTSGGTERWYYRHVPPGYDGTKPTPVVLDLHGYAEGAAVHVKMSGLGTYGDQQGFVTITPQGSGGAVARWDTALDSPDLDFIGDLLDEVDDTLCVDTDRVFVTGLSNGAFLTSAVACRYADRIAAAAPVAGIRDIDGCDPSRPVPVVAFHGTADTFVSYNGGYGSSVANLPSPDGSGKRIGEGAAAAMTTTAPGTAKPPTIEEITADWAKRNGCSAKKTEKKVASDVTLLAWSCPKGDEAELYRVEGGGHSWPGSPFSAQVASVVGRTTSSISADEIMWKFFQEHPLRRS